MKNLLPTTIVPPELYVERDADRHLRSILNDMGRPGYILVPRQMGKTNLLINAKRSLETNEDIFAYIDLSNRYENDRECFRSIIDSILDANIGKIGGLTTEINHIRLTTQLASHREHSRELRAILNCIKGKLVINLDEIDSLASADFSDKIFAHVRSIYFERVNFKEFERLTYILSGVTEPSEIIKDKSISPFNIGQKIFLGDFTKAEFMQFLHKSKLVWEIAIQDRVFYWTKGNPRLTWEICSSLEDASIDGKGLSQDLVDDIVGNLYLSNFDRAPVDHIRTLVQSDKSLREAVIAIIYNRSESISDRSKTRLYLAGILGSDYENGKIEIKNKIIELSLDIKWIQEIELQERVNLRDAEECFEAKNYRQAADLFRQIMDNADSSRDTRLTAVYKRGICCFKLGDHQGVLDCYLPNLVDKDGYRDLYIDQIYHLAASYVELGKLEEALSYFTIVTSDGGNKYRYGALANKAMLMYMNDRSNRDVSLEICQSIISDHQKGQSVPTEALSSAYYALGNFSEDDGNLNDSYEHYEKSFEAGGSISKLSPLLRSIAVMPSALFNNFQKVLETLSTGQIKVVEDTGLGLGFSISRIAELVRIISELKQEELLDSLFSSIQEHCLVSTDEYGSVLLQVSVSLLNSQNFQAATNTLLRAQVLDRQFYRADDFFQINRFLYFLDSGNEFAAETYFKGFQNYVVDADGIDLNIFYRKISKYLSDDNIQKASNYCDLILSSSRDPSLNLLAIHFLKFKTLANTPEKLEYAYLIRNFLKEVKNDITRAAFISKDMIASISRGIEYYISNNQKLETFIRNEKKYGRNEKINVKYLDGRVIITKYKYIKDDLKNGRCEMVDH